MYPVDTIDWNTLGLCNLRCLHCYGPDKRLHALPFDDLIHIVDRMREMEIRCVVLTGGEPLLTPHVKDLLAYISSSGIKIALSTNGTYVDRFWNAIVKHIQWLNIPIDGPTAEIHALSRIDTSTFYTNIETLRRYQANKTAELPKLRIGTVYATPTTGRLLEIAALLLPFADIITTWKIYELINHEVQTERRAPILHHHSDFVTEIDRLMSSADITALRSKIMIASAASRDRAYFMLNPRAQVVVPTKVGVITVEKVVGHFLEDDLGDLVGQWLMEVDPSNYHSNHSVHYEK